MMESSKKNEEIGAWFLEPIKEGKTHEEKDIGSQLKGSILEYWQQVFDESYCFVSIYCLCCCQKKMFLGFSAYDGC